jgi:hypothetical protein
MVDQAHDDLTVSADGRAKAELSGSGDRRNAQM